MIRATRIITCVGLLALAASLPLSEHDEGVEGIYVPWFTQPDMDTTWISTHNYSVEWDIDTVDNFNAALYFMIDRHNFFPLAKDFNLTEGQVEVTAPKISSGQYRLFLAYLSNVTPLNVTGPLFTLNRS